ncbi:hypothetical protein ACFOW4_05130 [Micromonospora sp. GCM10011542]
MLRGIGGWLVVAHTPDKLSVRFYTTETHEWDMAGVSTSSWLSTDRS